MIKFVNAKLNLGLNIVRRREDGYHDLETVFYPVGLLNGTPANPSPFCDILEITPSETTEFEFSGRRVDCPLEKNLVYKAWQLFKMFRPQTANYRIALEKHLPDGAGLGGGSADASFVLVMLNDLEGKPFSLSELAEMALRLGADCPFFICNKPCFASGVGERLEPISLSLAGWWCLLVKPDLHISTKEAFAGIRPKVPQHSLIDIASRDVASWQGAMENDFEKSLFPKHPVLGEIKEALLAAGAAYSAMSGSGSTLFGLFPSREAALDASQLFQNHFTAVCLLE